MSSFVVIQKICRSCGSKKLNKILSLGEQYLSDFVKGDRKPSKFPLELIICNECSLVQLHHTVSQSMLYTKRYGYKSGMNNTMQKELKKIVDKSMEKALKGKEKIIAVDIGANDGTLLSNYPKSIFRVGIEPIKKFAKECRENADIVINDFFNIASYKKKVGNKKAKIITVISCFYDMEDPNEFLSGVAEILDRKGVLTIQQNYLVGMLEQNAFDNIVHEHLEYYSLYSLEKLLAKHSLEIFDVELSSINGGSFRTYICHTEERKQLQSVYKLREKEKKLQLMNKKIYTTFAKNVKENKYKLRSFIKKIIKMKKSVYIYGASTRGNTLIQFYKLDKKLITAAVERNPEKWGKKIASMGIPIISEEQARKEKPDYMLILPWFFKDEFLQREKHYLHKGGHFIIPLPVLQIV